MITTSRVDLKVLYPEKNDARKLRALWDAGQRTWYVPPGLELDRLGRWLPNPTPVATQLADPESPGVSLSAFLDRVKDVIRRVLAAAEWVRVEIR